MELEKLVDLKKEQLAKVSNVEFKKEGLGALEFDLIVGDSTFEGKEVHFRIERAPAQTFIRISSKKDLDEIIEETLKSFVALPIEAKKINFFDFDADALTILTTLTTALQTKPFSFR